MSLTEFEIIEQYFRQHVVNHPHVILGIGDDAAILKVPSNLDLVISTDTLVANIHFPENMSPEDVGYRSLAVNLSDMAAMGADPNWFTLALTLPAANETWLKGFSTGLFQLASEYKLALIGGDITRGPLTITIQIHGFTDQGMAIRRSGARPADLIYVTGDLGAAGIALDCMNKKIEMTPAVNERALARYLRPSPRVAAGLVLRGLASSAIDISDGLLADLGHILDASETGATIRIEDLPLFPVANEIDRQDVIRYALSSGDDYELCFTVPREYRQEMQRNLGNICPVTCIGEITDSNGLVCIDGDNQLIIPENTGYQHFN